MMLMKETEEKPTYVAIIISSPLTWFSRMPYPQPNKHASGMAIPMAPANPATPTSPNSMLRVAPSSPAIIPSGRPLGIIAGLLGATLSIELGLVGVAGFAGAIGIAIPLACLFGWGYGILLNHVKGDEMMIATYVGFSSVSFMSIMWMILPYHSPTMIWGYSGQGLRTTVSVDGFWSKILDSFLAIRIGPNFIFPTGTILFFALMAWLMWAFFHTKTGTAMTAVGSNPDYARASGISVDRMRTTSVILSTVYGAIGILLYEQSYGFISLYNGPFFMALPAVAAILIGGASVNKANITNVIIGTILFQGILTMAPSVINAAIHSDAAEVVRLIVSNGMIVYALTRVTRKSR